MGIFDRLFGALRKGDPDEDEFEEDEYYAELYHNAHWGTDKPDDEDFEDWYEDIFPDEEDEED